MKITRLTKEQKEFFLGTDPLMMLDRLEFPDSFALVATMQDETTKEDIPAGLMICSFCENSLIIEWLCIAAKYRMQGIGEQMLLAVFDMAVQGNLPCVCAYFNHEYGRELICSGEEAYFKERLFRKEQALPGEWFTDLRTLSSNPFFNGKTAGLPQPVPLRKLTGPAVRNGIASLSKIKGTAMMYPASGHSELFDPDLSFLLFSDDKVCGGILVQCVSRDLPEARQGVLVRMTANVLYPVLFCAGSLPDAQALLYASLQAANAKYDPDTDVHIIMGHDTYTKLVTAILPKNHTPSNLLMADVADYIKLKKHQRYSYQK